VAGREGEKELYRWVEGMLGRIRAGTFHTRESKKAEVKMGFPAR